LCPSKLVLCPSNLEGHKSSLGGGGTTKNFFRRFAPEFRAPHFEIPSGAPEQTDVQTDILITVLKCGMCVNERMAVQMNVEESAVPW